MEILIDAVLKVLDDDSDHGFQIVTGKVFRLNKTKECLAVLIDWRGSGRRGEDVSLGFDQGSSPLCFSNIGIGQHRQPVHPTIDNWIFFSSFTSTCPANVFFMPDDWCWFGSG